MKELRRRWIVDKAKEAIQFTEIFNEVMQIEGGFSNDPNDRGGATKYGISLAFAQTVPDEDRDGFQDLDLDRDGDVDSDDIKLLTTPLAKAVYMKYFYEGPRINELPVEIRHQAFDYAVHSGPRTAVRKLQETLTIMDYWPGPLDGVIGPMTIEAAAKAISEVGFGELNWHYADMRRSWLIAIQEQDKSQRKWTGWIPRAERFMNEKNIIKGL